jgi:hypothetical protein
MEIINVMLISGISGVLIGFVVGYILAILIWKPLINQWQRLYDQNDEFYKQHVEEYHEILKNLAQARKD